MIIAVTCLGTYALSFLIEKYHQLVLMKDMADAGYKLKENNDPDTHKNIKVVDDYILIPFLNVYEAVSNYIQYINSKYLFLTEAHMLDLIEEMSKKEKEIYNKKPTMLNAYFLQSKMEFRRRRSQSLDYEDGSQIFFNINDKKGVELVEVIGPLNRKSESEQKVILVESLNAVLDFYEEKYKENNFGEDLEKELENIAVTRSYLEKAKDNYEGDVKIRKLSK